MLLVEDHDDVAQALQDLLEGVEQSVVRVGSGRDAIERVREHRYALALIDVRLPDMTGFELASELRRLRDDISLVELSGFPASNFAPEPLQTLDDYLLKAPSPADLERIIGRAQQGSANGASRDRLQPVRLRPAARHRAVGPPDRVRFG